MRDATRRRTRSDEQQGGPAPWPGHGPGQMTPWRWRGAAPRGDSASRGRRSDSGAEATGGGEYRQRAWRQTTRGAAARNRQVGGAWMALELSGSGEALGGLGIYGKFAAVENLKHTHTHGKHTQLRARPAPAPTDRPTHGHADQHACTADLPPHLTAASEQYRAIVNHMAPPEGAIHRLTLHRPQQG